LHYHESRSSTISSSLRRWTTVGWRSWVVNSYSCDGRTELVDIMNKFWFSICKTPSQLEISD
jgi:hypothetical protein